MNLVLFNHHRRSTGILPPSIRLLALTNAVAAYAARLEQEEREEKRLRIHLCAPEPIRERKPRIVRPPVRTGPMRSLEERNEQKFAEMRERMLGRMPKVQGRSGAWADQTKAVQGGL